MVFNNKKQIQIEPEPPSDDAILSAQQDLARIQSEVDQHNQFLFQQQQHLEELKRSQQLAQHNLSSLQNQKSALESEKQQTQFVKDLRLLADEINALSWELGLKLQEFQSRLAAGIGMQMNRSKQIVVEAIDIHSIRRYPAPNSQLLPFIFHKIGSGYFSLALRTPSNPDQPDRLAELRQLNGADKEKA